MQQQCAEQVAVKLRVCRLS